MNISGQDLFYIFALPIEQISRTEGIDMAKKSGAYEFIKEFPKQFDQMLGRRFEDGDELSGGQWQKLATEWTIVPLL
ncbi:hypothetical protein A3C24_03465 [Candidatus Roizmanbacteria bacterium RIFCSPHIGHO2_02_FULL_37_24]|uniref:ABC transporter domain-containing protein n=1 Tax=Candidatus Roizmanbacteria bacterium RIFCSPHIGHO2_02_FULL_37_24 TaxID=1802037 RepID=A0A1F7GUW4_9BACT|nr:MAG: hypothetical protein A3C24_03465 [Candidatus Roizmanbacteria bacterium RIFCSPHIGHO2_02_FULL_37_24]OGK32452.1 MAG: hypothetical protein A3E10_03970 [Candidatus Roizmanbacteria bacterium RIFCSPHIGHO2_12_FULL_37_23]OGK44998.1 MAG: hypothetical protein A2956_00470 [Candidatus Roizmanbacteria bacterium RIFCSPLOWO2_01_FULL_37_57]OGK58943.1 MAG: hypothetical protein A3G65_04340 [Candidatus Roizmanbacteria bacterium RIFCSPLOWO2_12_FULL_37_7b]